MNKSLFFMAFLLLILPAVSFSVTTHCSRQDIGRVISPSLSVDSQGVAINTSNGSLIVPIGTILNYSNFGSYNYECDDGATGSYKNYVDLKDLTTSRILASNVSSYGSTVRGPYFVSDNMCIYNGGICYKNGDVFYPTSGACERGGSIGSGQTDQITFVLDTNMVGEHKLSLRLGLISPATTNPNDPSIMPKEMLNTNITVGEPSLLVFGQQKLKRIGYFDTAGSATQEVVFTVLNKSPFTIRLSNYSISCSKNAACSVEKKSNNEPLYKGFSLATNQSMIIPGEISFSKSVIPENFSAFLDLNYTADGINKCDIAKNRAECSTSSSAMTYEVGLLGQQNFQIGVYNESAQKFCVDADGAIGRTGDGYVPRVSLSFTGAVSINACSPTDFASGEANPNWVYCSQREFLLQLAKHIGIAAENFESIAAAEYDKNLSRANALRLTNAKLLNYNAGLIVQKFDAGAINSSLERISPDIFTSAGLPGVFGSNQQAKLAGLIKSISFVQTINGVATESLDISPGTYRVSIDANSVAQSAANGWQLFLPDGSVNPSIQIKVSFEKVSSPSFDWFFYDVNDPVEYFSNPVDSAGSPYVTNVANRGEVMRFVDNNGTKSKIFFKESAVPIAIRISDSNHSSSAEAYFSVLAGQYPINSNNFSYWTGFASSVGNGCETISTLPDFGNKTLPYRIADENISHGGILSFNIPGFDKVIRDSNMYLETVLYLPVNSSETFIRAPFGIYSAGTSCTPSSGGQCALEISNTTFGPSTINTGVYRVSSIADIFNKIRDENVCVIKDSSLGKTTWKLFWNQDAVIFALNNFKKSITDAKICPEREYLLSS